MKKKPCCFLQYMSRQASNVVILNHFLSMDPEDYSFIQKDPSLPPQPFDVCKLVSLKFLSKSMFCSSQIILHRLNSVKEKGTHLFLATHTKTSQEAVSRQKRQHARQKALCYFLYRYVLNSNSIQINLAFHHFADAKLSTRFILWLI